MNSIVLTKPADQQQRWTAALRAEGWTVHSLPLLTLQDLPESAQMRATWQDLDQFAGVIMISPRAAECTARALDRWWPQPPVGLHWLCSGSGTRRVLAQHWPELSIKAPTRGNRAEDILDLPETREVAEQKWLLVAGEGGRTLLQDTLSERGARVTRLSLYQRQPVRLTSDELQALTTWVSAGAIIQVSSALALQSLTSQVAVVTKHKARLLTSSPRLTALAREQGWEQILQADGASLEATAATLADHRTLK
ncbi:uroporphyrinogen-III synthase [Natronospirillum operosum]|uniref:Uroporphyrinogen-III synthase n=1 Tax=Natronospirillum operosum TaxID=2759953 RepID=A0A4Z0W7U9_9GAMM|nr:uroporphyrinogen-III synthase [Natronospirillum operosum]